MKQSEKLIKEFSLNESMDNKLVSQQLKKGLSIYMKILLNYLQMITIVQSFELKWPFYVRNYLNAFSTVGGGISTQVISIDCLLNDYDLSIVPLYGQTFILSVLPFVIYISAAVVLFVITIFKRKNQGIRFVVVVIVVSVFLQPSIIKILFDNLSCKTIDQNSYLTQDMSIECDSDSHMTWVKFLFLHYRIFSRWLFLSLPF